MKKTLHKKTQHRHSSEENPSTNETSTISEDQDDKENEVDEIDFDYQAKTKQPNKPEWIFHLRAPDERATIMGKWIYYVNGQQMDVIQQMSAGHQTITVSLDRLNPDRENQIRVQFQGTINGRSYVADKTYTLPSFLLSYQARTLQLKNKGTEDDLIEGDLMISVRNAKKEVVENCNTKKKPLLTCKLPNLPPGQYEVIASYLSIDDSFAFRKKGKLEIRANQQDLFTTEPSDSFPDWREIEEQQAEDQWENDWWQWKYKKITSSPFPKFEVHVGSTGFVSATLRHQKYFPTKATLFIALYNEQNQLVNVCQIISTTNSCKLPEQSFIKVSILFEGAIGSQKWPIGIVQNGTIQNGKLTLSSPQYTRDTKPIKEKMAAIQKQEKQIEDKDSNYFYIAIVIFVFFLIIGVGKYWITKRSTLS